MHIPCRYSCEATEGGGSIDFAPPNLKFYLSLLAGNPLKTSPDLAHTLDYTSCGLFWRKFYK